MKTRKKTRGVLSRLGQLFSRALRPRNALPCVGLVVLGGCLTFIITPDEPESGSGERAVVRESGEFPTVIIDPGHGGKDEGTKWRGVAERELTLDVAQRLERLLKTGGFPTMLTRRENVYVSLEDRVRIANTYKDALFISIHFNSDPTTNSNGIETYYAREKSIPTPEWTWIGFFNKHDVLPPDDSETLAGSIHTALIGRTQAKNRGIKGCNYYVVHHTRCPSVLVEAGFISNAFESQLLSSDTYREILAEGITEGVLRYQKKRGQEGQHPPMVSMDH